MQINVEDVSGLTKKMVITLPGDMVSKELDAAYKKLNSEASLKGFRKGKIPRKVLEKNYGPKVENDVAEKLIQESYFDALEQSSIEAVVHPEIKDQKFGDDGTFYYEAYVDVRPDFELGEYKGLVIEQTELTVTDDELEAELVALQKQMAPLQTVTDRGIEKGDLAVVDFQGFHNGNAMKQVVGENYSIDVGSGQYGQEFEDKLVGFKKGDEVAQEVDFPETFENPVLAGKKVEFKINVKEVKERQMPELNDEFAQEVNKDFKTLGDLKDNIKKTRLAAKEDADKGSLNDKLMKKLIENHDFEIPPRLVAYEIDNLIKELENNLQQQAMTLESAGMNRDNLVEQYKPVAESRVKGDFILKKVAEVEEVKLENEDIDAGFQRIADQYNMQVPEVKKFFQSRDDLMPFLAELLNEKILTYLMDAATIETVPAEAANEEEAEA